jgi:hypothetical protein
MRMACKGSIADTPLELYVNMPKYVQEQPQQLLHTEVQQKHPA